MASTKVDISDCVSKFTLSLYQQVASAKPSDNIFLSPCNVAIVMTMVYVGARAETENQMAKALKLPPIDRNRLVQKMKEFLERLEKGNIPVTLNMVNRLFPHSDKRIREDYLSTVKRFFGADIKPMNFTDQSEESRLEINNWVQEKTKDKIKDLLPDGALNPLTAMVIVNTIYFKGNWETPFETKFTTIGEFTMLNSKKVPVQMMRVKLMEDVRYGRDKELSCKLLVLPYEGCKIEMIIILPNEIDGLPELERKLSVRKLRSALRGLQLATADVTLPKFKLDSSVEMDKLLSELGMEDVFDEEKADLSGLGNELYVSQVYHKTFIDVNEEGTEAGAATAAVEVSRCLEEIHRFNASHPFLFMIWHNKLDTPLFIGRLLEPYPVSESHVQRKKRIHVEDWRMERQIKRRQYLP